ncbi:MULTISPECIES: outer membrane beta-barrel protein [unclassified Microcoleus]|uniref:outer membrane beta-barrel protein n=1 Tax=unclassified Microcoleus TaxID=2642155 RepID=UPI002FCFF86E
MRIMAVVFFSSSTFGAWVFNYPAIASPSPEILQNQNTSANSRAIELPEAEVYSEVTRVPNVEETRTLETQVDRGEVKMPVLKLTDLTPVSGTAAELLPVEHLQAQSPVPEGKPEAGIYSEVTRVPNVEATRVLETQVDRGEVKMPVLKLTDLTPVSRTPADLLPLERLQAQSPVPEKNPDFPEVPPPPPDEPYTPDESDNDLRKPDIIRRSLQESSRRQPNLELLLRSSAQTYSSINSPAINRETAFVNSALLRGKLDLGSETSLVADAGGSSVLFTSEHGYNALNFSFGVRQQLANNTAAELAWVQERLSKNGSSDDLVDNSLRLAVGRLDRLSSKLRLDSGYELRASFASPYEASLVRNTLTVGLRYDLTPRLQGRLDYQVVFDDFTRQDRLNTQQQITAMTVYYLNRNTFINGSVSYLVGDSYNRLTGGSGYNLNYLSIGVNIGYNLSIF